MSKFRRPKQRRAADVILILILIIRNIQASDEGLGHSLHDDTADLEHRQPNIVFVFTDDQAAWAMGWAVQFGWFDDVPAAHTPNLDSLAPVLSRISTAQVCTIIR